MSIDSIWYLRQEAVQFLINPLFIRVVTTSVIAPTALQDFTQAAMMDMFNSMFPLGAYRVGGVIRLYEEEEELECDSIFQGTFFI